MHLVFFLFIAALCVYPWFAAAVGIVILLLAIYAIIELNNSNDKDQ